MLDLITENKKMFQLVPPPRLELFTRKEESAVIQEEEEKKEWKYNYTGTYKPTSSKRRTTPQQREERRNMVEALMNKGHTNSYEIAKLLNEPRGTIWKHILEIKKHPRKAAPLPIPITIVKK